MFSATMADSEAIEFRITADKTTATIQTCGSRSRIPIARPIPITPYCPVCEMPQMGRSSACTSNIRSPTPNMLKNTGCATARPST